MKKRIAIIGLKGLPSFGGAAAVGEHLVKELSQNHEFTVYATRSHTSGTGLIEGSRQVIFKKFPIERLNILYYYIASAFHSVFRANYDLVHLHHIDGAFILFILRLKYKVISTSHGLTYETGKWSKVLYPYFKLNEWIQCRLSNHITLVSKGLYDHYRSLCKIEKISYIPNAVTIPVIERRPHQGLLVFSAGRIIPIKGLHLLLKALASLDQGVEMVVYGDIDQLAAYKKELLVQSASLKVKYAGLIRNKPDLNKGLSEAQLFIFPSLYETMSMMLLEVAALKVPLICSDIRSNTDVFTDEDVLFFKTDDSVDLGNKISWAFNNMETMKQKAESAFSKVSKDHSWKNVAHLYNSLYTRYMN